VSERFRSRTRKDANWKATSSRPDPIPPCGSLLM
jgi:hypothetical protein